MKISIVSAVLLLSVVACAPKAVMPKAPMLTPEQMQANMMEAGALRPEHALLKKMAGNWKVDVKMWMDPSAAPEVSKGRAKSNLIYGGRYLIQEYKGTFMGKPFEGQSTMGFDNVNAKYFSTWIDSFSTMLMSSEGVASNEGSIVMASSMTCPLTREHLAMEDVITFIDKNHFKYETFQNRGGQKIKGMELTYSRTK